MQIILLQDIAKVGKRGEVKNVSDGYARNFLLRQNLALPATPENVKKIEQESKQKAISKAKAHESFHALKTALAEKGIVIRKKARLPDGQTDTSGKLYAAISAKDVLAALHELNFPVSETISEKMISFDAPIKTIGKHEAVINLGNEKIKLQILCEPSS